MKNLITGLIIIGILTNLSAQNFQYVVQNNPNIRFLNCVYFPNPAVGYAVGDSGTIVKTIDSGNTWVTQMSNTNYRLTSVRFVNSNVGWAMGDTGTIRKTTDGGINWINQNFGSYNYWTASFVDNDTGYTLTNNKILKTTDGGNTWNTILSHNNSSPLLYFKSADTGFVGYTCDTILMTTNCGHNWIKVGNIGMCASTCFSFPNSNIGYTVGNNCPIKTTNGGTSWFCMNGFPLNMDDFGPTSMYFSSPDTGFFIGYDMDDLFFWFIGSEILKTTDGGNSWYTIPNIANGKLLTSSYFSGSNSGIIVGGNNSYTGNGHNGIILKINGNTLGVNNNFISNDIIVFPNPANGTLKVIFPDNTFYIKISNSLGKVIIKRNVKDQTESKFEIPERGIYYVQIVTEKETITKKIIIEN